MKRRFIQVACLLAMATTFRPMLGQDDAAQAAAVAQKEADEERYRRLNSAVEDLLAAQAAMQKRLASLADELRELRSENTRTANNYVSRDDFRRLAEKVQEIEQRREKDNKRILDELHNLLKLPAPAPAPATVEPAPKPSNSIDKGYEHVVEANQTLSLIIQAYREQGVKVSLKQVLDANPGLNPNKVRVGQKIFIPDPNK